MSDFRAKVRARLAGLLTYGLTPPRASNDDAKLSEIAHRQRLRIATLPVDAVVLYDLQDESNRDDSPRPFPFLPTLDPFAYARDYLGGSGLETIVYRAVGNYEEAAFSAWLAAADGAPEPTAVTFVGSPTAQPTGRLGLRRAYELYGACCERLLLGGVCIAERHAKKGDEHRRILDKQRLGCAFFVSQAVYDPAANRALLADLAREAQARGVEPAPLLLTITPCGSEKALEFMKWLGIAFDPKLERRLRQSSDMLGESMAICEEMIREVASQTSSPIPLGINVESVSIRRADIDAAESLVAFARRELDAHS